MENENGDNSRFITTCLDAKDDYTNIKLLNFNKHISWVQIQFLWINLENIYTFGKIVGNTTCFFLHSVNVDTFVVY